MYTLRRQAAVEKGIATLLALALVTWVVGAYFFQTAEAANLTSIKDTLSNSAPSESSNHTFAFTVPAGGDGVAATENITIAFPSGFNISGIAFGDVDLSIGGSDQTLAAVASGATWGVSVSGQNLILTSGSGTVATGTAVVIEVGTNATFGVAGDTQITNPAATTSYEFTITAGDQDSGQFRVALVDDVLVTANVNTALTFTVAGTSTGTTLAGVSGTTATTTTSDTLPFETLSAGTPKLLAQQLRVTTNAIQGYVVTVEQSQNLLSSTGADIDGFIDGAYTNTPTAWVAPTNNIANENTWGHWGLTSSDSDFSATPDRWVAASTTPRAIMAHTGPSDGVTPGVGFATVGYKAEITALQEAGDDYNTTLTYIATPTF